MIGRCLSLLLLVAVAVWPAAPALALSDAQFAQVVARWKANMASAGRPRCEHLKAQIKAQDWQGALASTYYDAQGVYLSVARALGDPTGYWKGCADAASSQYRGTPPGYNEPKDGGTGYVLRVNGHVPGYWNFTDGLAMSYAATKAPLDLQAIDVLHKNAAYCAGSTQPAWTAGLEKIREVAYCIRAYYYADKLGLPKVIQAAGTPAEGAGKPRRLLLVDQQYGHLKGMFVTHSWKGTDQQFSPFMVGLAVQALWLDYQDTKDPRFLPTIKTAADWLRANAWSPMERAFGYQLNPGCGGSCGGREPAPDLNMLIVPAFGAVYALTGDTKYRDWGDEVFAGGVDRAFTGGNKQYNQQYEPGASFRYVEMRGSVTAPSSSTSGNAAASSASESRFTIAIPIPSKAEAVARPPKRSAREGL
jgi:hypothetical protein